MERKRWQPLDQERWRTEDPRGGWSRLLPEMSEPEIESIEQRYGCRVRRPTKEEKDALAAAVRGAVRE